MPGSRRRASRHSAKAFSSEAFGEAFSRMSDTVIIELTEAGWAEAVAAAEAWLDRLAGEMELDKK